MSHDQQWCLPVHDALQDGSKGRDSNPCPNEDRVLRLEDVSTGGSIWTINIELAVGEGRRSGEEGRREVGEGRRRGALALHSDLVTTVGGCEAHLNSRLFLFTGHVNHSWLIVGVRKVLVQGLGAGGGTPKVLVARLEC